MLLMVTELITFLEFHKLTLRWYWQVFTPRILHCDLYLSGNNKPVCTQANKIRTSEFIFELPVYKTGNITVKRASLSSEKGQLRMLSLRGNTEEWPGFEQTLAFRSPCV